MAGHSRAKRPATDPRAPPARPWIVPPTIGRYAAASPKLDVILLFTLMLTAAGLVATGFGIAMSRNRIPLLWRGMKTTREIARIERHKGAPGRPRGYTAWVRVTDAAGTTRTMRMDRSTSTRPKPGGGYAIRYDASKPEMAFADSVST